MKNKRMIIGTTIGFAFICGIVCWKISTSNNITYSTDLPFQHAEPLAVSLPESSGELKETISISEGNPEVGIDGSILISDHTFYKMTENLEGKILTFEIPYPALCTLSISSEINISADIYFERISEKTKIDQTQILQKENSIVTRFLQTGLYFIRLYDTEPEITTEFTIMYTIDSEEDMIGNSYEQAYNLTIPDKVVSDIEYIADEDWYTFDVEHEREIIISLTGKSDFMAVLYLLDENDDLVYISDNQSPEELLEEDKMLSPENDEAHKDKQQEETKETTPASKDIIQEEAPSFPEKTVPTQKPVPDSETEKPVEPTSIPQMPSIRDNGLRIQQMTNQKIENATQTTVEDEEEIISSIPETELTEMIPEKNIAEKPENNQSIKVKLTEGKYYLRIYNINLIVDTYRIQLQSGILSDFGNTWDTALELQENEEYMEIFDTYIDEDWYVFNVLENTPVQLDIVNCEANILVYKNIYGTGPVYYDNQSLEKQGNKQMITFTDAGQYFIRMFGGNPSQNPYEIVLRGQSEYDRG